jgi:hypothetical protein
VSLLVLSLALAEFDVQLHHHLFEFSHFTFAAHSETPGTVLEKVMPTARKLVAWFLAGGWWLLLRGKDSLLHAVAKRALAVVVLVWFITAFGAWWYHVSNGEVFQSSSAFPCHAAHNAMLLHSLLAVVVFVRVALSFVRSLTSASRADPTMSMLFDCALPPARAYEWIVALAVACAYAVSAHVESAASPCHVRPLHALQRCRLVVLFCTLAAMVIARRRRVDGKDMGKKGDAAPTTFTLLVQRINHRVQQNRRLVLYFAISLPIAYFTVSMMAQFLKRTPSTVVKALPPIFLHARLIGGVGNCMFEFQSVLGIARRNGGRAIFARRDLARLRDVFKLPSGGNGMLAFEEEEVDSLETKTAEWPRVLEADNHVYDTAFDALRTNSNVGNYLQSFDYVRPLGLNIDNVHSMWTFRDDVLASARELLREHAVWIGVHVRRFPRRHTDRTPSAAEYQAVVDAAVAASVGAALDADVCVMVFSSDQQWARAHVAADCIRFASNNLVVDPDLQNSQTPREAWASHSGRDLAALSLCNVIILSSGSFGMFAGLLQRANVRNGVVYAYRHAEHSLLHPSQWQQYPPRAANGGTLTGIGAGSRAQRGSTLVTAYFNIASKHSHDRYMRWIETMMSVQDNMVIFTSPDLVDTLMLLRKDATEYTRIVPMLLNETLMGTQLSRAFWKRQFDLDPEKDIHQSFELYWIWNEKTEWLHKAVELDPFNSDFFAWMDIGYLREDMWRGARVVRRVPPALGRSQVMVLNIEPFPLPLPSATEPLSDVYVGGGFIGGYKEGIARWRNLYYTMMTGPVYAHSFVGKDQHQMASTCLATPDLCFLVLPTNEVSDKWFFVASYVAGKTRGNPLPVNNDTQYTSISVCISSTFHDVAANLPRLLASIDRQRTRPKEVIVIVSGMQKGVHCEGVRNTLLGVDHLLNTMRVECVDKWPVGRVRNYAAELATADLITFVDATSYMLDFRLSALLAIYRTHAPHMILHGSTSAAKLIPVWQAGAWKMARAYKGCELFDIARSTADDVNHRELLKSLMHSQMTVKASVFKQVRFIASSGFNGAEDFYFVREVIKYFGRVDGRCCAIFFRDAISYCSSTRISRFIHDSYATLFRFYRQRRVYRHAAVVGARHRAATARAPLRAGVAATYPSRVVVVVIVAVVVVVVSSAVFDDWCVHYVGPVQAA